MGTRALRPNVSDKLNAEAFDRLHRTLLVDEASARRPVRKRRLIEAAKLAAAGAAWLRGESDTADQMDD